MGRVAGAAGRDARRRDDADAGPSARSGNTADRPAPPQQMGQGLAGAGCVARRPRWLHIACLLAPCLRRQSPCARPAPLLRQAPSPDISPGSYCAGGSYRAGGVAGMKPPGRRANRGAPTHPPAGVGRYPEARASPPTHASARSRRSDPATYRQGTTRVLTPTCARHHRHLRPLATDPGETSGLVSTSTRCVACPLRPRRSPGPRGRSRSRSRGGRPCRRGRAGVRSRRLGGSSSAARMCGWAALARPTSKPAQSLLWALAQSYRAEPRDGATVLPTDGLRASRDAMVTSARANSPTRRRDPAPACRGR